VTSSESQQDLDDPNRVLVSLKIIWFVVFFQWFTDQHFSHLKIAPNLHTTAFEPRGVTQYPCE